MFLVFRALNGRLDSRVETDLHGLTVKEALELLPFLLRRAQSRRQQNLVVITGEGNHSAGGTARLKPAVLKWLSNAKFRYVVMNPAGSIKVMLR
jgi:NEDD4-binding protein 2